MILSPSKDFTSYVLVNKEKVLASLDSGAWISTCSPVFAESRNLVLKKIEPFQVFVSDGTKVVVDSKVDVKLQITTQGPVRKVSIYVLKGQPVLLNIGIPELSGYSLTFGDHPQVTYLETQDCSCKCCSGDSFPPCIRKVCLDATEQKKSNA